MTSFHLLYHFVVANFLHVMKLLNLNTEDQITTHITGRKEHLELYDLILIDYDYK